MPNEKKSGIHVTRNTFPPSLISALIKLNKNNSWFLTSVNPTFTDWQNRSNKSLGQNPDAFGSKEIEN